MPRLLATFAMTALMALGLLATPASAAQQSGLVNLNVEDNTVQIPVALAANVCGVTVAILAQDLTDGTAECDSDAQALADANVTQDPPQGNTVQEGLININIEGNTVQVPIAAAVNICGVTVLVLVQDVLFGDATCEAQARGNADA
jgi:hypothetical protein